MLKNIFLISLVVLFCSNANSFNSRNFQCKTNYDEVQKFKPPLINTPIDVKAQDITITTEPNDNVIYDKEVLHNYKPKIEGTLENHGQQAEITLECEVENAEVTNNICECKNGFEKLEGETLCTPICDEGQDFADGKCYDKEVLNEITCEDGYEIDIESGECVLYEPPLMKCADGICSSESEAEGGSCSMSSNMANPANLIFLFSFLIPAFKRKS